MNSKEQELANRLVADWDLDTLIDYASESLGKFYEDNSDIFKKELNEYNEEVTESERITK